MREFKLVSVAQIEHGSAITSVGGEIADFKRAQKAVDLLET
jgi:hypothetical protein